MLLRTNAISRRISLRSGEEKNYEEAMFPAAVLFSLVTMGWIDTSGRLFHALWGREFCTECFRCGRACSLQGHKYRIMLWSAQLAHRYRCWNIIPCALGRLAAQPRRGFPMPSTSEVMPASRETGRWVPQLVESGFLFLWGRRQEMWPGRRRKAECDQLC